MFKELSLFNRRIAMTNGYCMYHHRWMTPDELREKSCRKKENTGKKCKHLRLKSTKDRYYNANKGLR